MDTTLIAQYVLAGLVIGVIYCVMAVGITFIYSVMKMINWALGEFYMIGGYLQDLLITRCRSTAAGSSPCSARSSSWACLRPGPGGHGSGGPCARRRRTAWGRCRRGSTCPGWTRSPSASG